MENEEDVVAMCVDCGSVIPDSQAEKDKFLQAGKTGVCKWCGGPVIVAYASERDRINEQRRAGKLIGG